MARQFREQLEEEVELENARKAQRATSPPPAPPFDPVPAAAAPGDPAPGAAATASPVPPPLHGPTMPAPTMPDATGPMTPGPPVHADNPGDETGANPAERRVPPPSADERGT